MSYFALDVEGEREAFRLGSISNIVEAAKWYRSQQQKRLEINITGLPTHWINAVKRSGLFSNDKNNILEVVVHGSSRVPRDRVEFKDKFDVDAELEKYGLGDFKGYVKYTWVGTTTVEIDFSALPNETGPTPNITQLINMIQLRNILQDAVIRYILVKSNDGKYFLWASFPRHKLKTGQWDEWSKAIDSYHKAVYGKYKRIGSLDLVAYSEYKDWYLDDRLVRNSLMDAYDPNRFKDALKPLVKGTEAEGLLTVRTEGAWAPPFKIRLQKLFT
jgi:hypothetical protein